MANRNRNELVGPSRVPSAAVFVTSHALAGATLGLLLRRPVPAFVAGNASHVVMDVFPHWGDQRISWEEFLRVARVDGLAGLAVAGVVTAAAPRPAKVAALAGLAGACLMDLDKAGRHLIGRSPFPGHVDRFHQRIQNESPTRMWVEAAGATLLSALLLATLQRATGKSPSAARA